MPRGIALALITVILAGCGRRKGADPAAAESFVRQARQLASAHRMQNALNALAQAETEDPTRADIFVLRARMLEDSSHLREALEEARAAHRLAPRDPQVSMALLHYAVNFIQPGETEAIAREAAALNPDLVQAWLWLGRCIALSEDPRRFPEALKAFQQARRAEPESPEPLTEMGKLYSRMGDNKSAIGSLEASSRLLDFVASHPGMPYEVLKHYLAQRSSVEFLLARCYARADRPADSRKAMARASEWSSRATQVRVLETRAAAVPPDPQAALDLQRIASSGPAYWGTASR